MSRNSTAKGSIRNGRSKLSHILSCKGFNHDIEAIGPHSNNTSGLPNIRKDPSQERIRRKASRESFQTLEQTKIVNDLAESLNHLYIFKKGRDREDETKRNKMLERKYELSLGNNDFSIKETNSLLSQNLFKLVQKRNERSPTTNATYSNTITRPDRDLTLSLVTPPHIAPASTNSASLLQKLYVKNLGNIAIKTSKTPGGGSPYTHSPASSASPKRRTRRKGSISHVFNFHPPTNNPSLAGPSSDDTEKSHLEHRIRVVQKAFASKPNSGASTPVPPLELEIPKKDPDTKYKRVTDDPFNRLVKYKDSTMPFSLAVNAEARQRIFNEMKRVGHEKVDLNSIVELRDKKIPEARAKFLETLTDIESKKKDDELRSRSQEKNTLYQIYALDKDTQRKVRKKLKRQLSENSRFVNIH